MKITAVVLLVLSGLMACGPEQTSKEKEDQQIALDTAQEEAILKPLEGRYIGTLTVDSGDSHRAQLTLVYMPILNANAGRNENSLIPNLQGELNLCLEKEECFKDKDKSVLRIGNFASMKFNPATHKLFLVNAPIAAGANSPHSPMSLDVKLEGGHVTGRVSTALVGGVGNLDLVKID